MTDTTKILSCLVTAQMLWKAHKGYLWLMASSRLPLPFGDQDCLCHLPGP